MAPSFDEFGCVDSVSLRQMSCMSQGHLDIPRHFDHVEDLHRLGYLDQFPADFYEPRRTKLEVQEEYTFDALRPCFPDLKWARLQEVPYEDKALQGDVRSRNLLREATDTFDYNPKIGTEVVGIDLAHLTAAQKDDLARLVSERGVVFFRNQYNFDITSQRSLGAYYGVLHRHATASVPSEEGLEDVHVIYTSENFTNQTAFFTPTFLWHSDVTYEIQPPSYTILKTLTGPPRGSGGDTLWSSQYAAYDALSPSMQQYLENLTALHSAERQAEGSRAVGRPIRRNPVITEHPLIRVHPVTGWKSLFFNPGFVTKIVGIPKTESEMIIKHLNEIIATTHESHCRFQWGEHDVVIWDNRVTNHTAAYGFAPYRYHAVRVACHAEKPYFDPCGKSQEEELNRKGNLSTVNEDSST